MRACSFILAAGLALTATVAAPVTATARELQPLTLGHVSGFFSQTLGLRPTEVQKRCVIFYEGEWKSANDYDYCVIIVENSDEDLQVPFYLTDDREMNWVNEFLDGPFFSTSETENLFRLLHQPKPARRERVGRFRVDVSHWAPRHAEIIVFSFTPRKSVSR